MAQIKKIVRRNNLSQFQQVAPDGGATFRALAEGLNEVYDRTAPAAQETMERLGRERGRELARREIGGAGAPGASVDALALIRDFEGFSESPYWDVNAFRAGYGSDTFTSADGTVRKIQQGDRVSREDAERDLQRRLTQEFLPSARAAVGADVFDMLGSGQRAVLGSLAYNYGAGAWGDDLSGVAAAVRSGGDVSAAISALGAHNDGINMKRRQREASLYASGEQFLEDTGPSVAIHEAAGEVGLRKYSPYAGPILQAHDAAAKVAYQAETLNAAAISLQEIGNQFEYDPVGYEQAAKSYIDQMVSSAPAEVRSDLRSSLETTAHKRLLGVMDASHRQTRSRADNASRALVERWSNDLATAIAAGDENEIAAAQRNLDSVLQAREALPGVAWTTEQSANVFLKAEAQAEKLIEKKRKQRSSDYKDQFQLIAAAAKAGRQAEGEELLQNPEAVSMHPEEAREAAAFASLRDNSPGFLQLTPDQQAEEIARLSSEPVGEGWQIDVVEAAEKMSKANRKAWDDDPVKRAGQVLETPPPDLPDFTTEEPEKFVASLAARREYMRGIQAAGYTETKAFLSEDEADQLGVLMGKGTDTAIRAAISGAIVAGFGSDAVRVFDEIGGDRTTMFAGKMQALGGKPQVAEQILRGQQLLEENMVQLPKQASRLAAFNSEVAGAMAGIPGGLEAQAEVMEAAKALYASQAQGIEQNSDAAKSLMSQSIQTVLGQAKNKRGELTGGVQKVMGHQTLLPVGVSGTKVDRALRLSLGQRGADGIGMFGRFTGALTGLGVSALGGSGTEAAEIWAAAGVDGVPQVSGKSIPSRYVESDMVRPVAIGGNLYRLEITNGSAKLDVEDGKGDVLIFDLAKLVEAAG